MNKAEDFFKSLKAIYISFSLWLLVLSPRKVFLTPKLIRNLPMFSSGAFMVSFYTLVLGTGSFSCHFLSSKCKVGPKRLGVWGREGAATADASRCGALTSFSSSRNPSQETSHFPSWGWVRGNAALPEKHEKNTWPDQNLSYRNRAKGLGEGDGVAPRRDGIWAEP